MTPALLYRRRWFALKKCHVQFMPQSVVIDVSYLWQLFHDFLCRVCALALSSEGILMPDKGESAALLSLQHPSVWLWLYPVLGLSVTQSARWRWKIQQSSSAGSWQQVCGFNGNCKTLKFPVPERSLTEVRLGRAPKFWMSSRFVKEVKCLGKFPSNQVSSWRLWEEGCLPTNVELATFN